MSGEKLGIRLFLCSLSDKLIYNNCRIGISITSVSGANIVLSTEMICENEIRIQDRDFIDFFIEKLPLSEGTYSLSLFVESNGIIQDWITEGIQFSVEGGDFYGTGKPCPIGYQGKSILVDFSIVKNSYEFA